MTRIFAGLLALSIAGPLAAQDVYYPRMDRLRERLAERVRWRDDYRDEVRARFDRIRERARDQARRQREVARDLRRRGEWSRGVLMPRIRYQPRFDFDFDFDRRFGDRWDRDRVRWERDWDRARTRWEADWDRSALRRELRDRLRRRHRPI